MLLTSTILNFIVGLLIILYSFSEKISYQTIDVQQHDTYYVVSHSSVLIGLGIFLIGKAILVFQFRNSIEYKKLFSLNLVLDVITISFLVCFISSMHLNSIPRRYYRSDGFIAFSKFENINQIFSKTVFLFLLNQVFISTLIITSSLRKRKGISNNDILDK